MDDVQITLNVPETGPIRAIYDLHTERDMLATALFRIRSLTMRNDDKQLMLIANIACDAVRSIDETRLFPCMQAKHKGGE